MNIHRQIKRKRIEEGLWDDVKNKAKSLVGKGKPSSESNPLYKNRLSDIAQDIFELYVTPENKTTSSFILERFDQSKRKEVIEYYKSIGITYNPEIVSKYNAYAKEIRSFFSLLRNDTWGGYERVMTLLGMDQNKYKYYFEYRILDYLIDNTPIDIVFKRNSIIEGLEASFYIDMDAKKMLDIVLPKVKEAIDIRIFQKCDRIKQGIAFVKKQMDTVVNSDPSEIKLGIVKSKDELYNLFKYFYPNERVDEFVKKFNINKNIVSGSAEKFLPSEEGMKNMMKSKYGEKKTMTLKNYLEKKLTVSSKEAELIESVIKEYVKKKNKSSIKEYASFHIPLSDMMNSQITEIKKFESLDNFINRMEKKFPPNTNILHMYDTMRTKAPREYQLLNDEYVKLQQTVKENFKRKTVKETSHDLDPEETSLSRTLLPSKYGRHPYSYEPSMEDEDIVSKEEEEEFYKRHPELKRRKKRK